MGNHESWVQGRAILSTCQTQCEQLIISGHASGSRHGNSQNVVHSMGLLGQSQTWLDVSDSSEDSVQDWERPSHSLAQASTGGELRRKLASPPPIEKFMEAQEEMCRKIQEQDKQIRSILRSDSRHRTGGSSSWRGQMDAGDRTAPDQADSVAETALERRPGQGMQAAEMIAPPVKPGGDSEGVTDQTEDVDPEDPEVSRDILHVSRV
mmetsp:Transcript_55096/g.119020  ORF Transcript_55096/g.119020 Transcript_55096/m.119020 type:complete len:208 (+) Transcript_55096:178-801(+)